MAAFAAALALLGGVIGAGFASGRELVCFFGVHGRMAFAAVAASLLMLYLLFVRLPAQMAHWGAPTLAALCAVRLGDRFGRLCGALFALLCAITGGAMLAACAELGALVLPLRHAYGLCLAVTLALSALLAACGLPGAALPGALLFVLLPVLLARLLRLPAGEACFLPAMPLPARALMAGTAYGALSAAQLGGMLSLLLALPARMRRRAASLFCLLFGAVLSLGVLVCLRHLPAVMHQPLPFVFLSRGLGRPGYFFLSACMYLAALSTLVAMLRALMDAMRGLLPASSRLRAVLCALVCLLFAFSGFSSLVSRAYPVLGALCAALLLVLCAPVPHKDSPPIR